MPVRDFTFTNNLARHNSFGVHGQGQSIGQGTLDTYVPDGVFGGNVLGGGQASRYPPGNFFPSDAAFSRQFANFDGDDYRLAGSSDYRTAATDSRAIGADVEAVLARTAGVEAGRPESDSDPAGAAIGQLPASSFRLPACGFQLSAFSFQLSAFSYQLPVADYCLHYRRPTTDKRPTTNDHRPTTTDHCLLPTAYCLLTTGH